MVNVDLDKLEEALRKEHPQYVEGVHRKDAIELSEKLDKRFEELLNGYLETGEEKDFSHDEFSLLLIMALRKCSYIRAIELMDEYVKDPLAGKAMILRR